MFFDIYIKYEDKEDIIYLFKDVFSKKGAYAYSLFVELININDGLWKGKELVSIDGCWGELKVKKKDLLYFIERVNLRSLSEKKLITLKDKEKKGVYSSEKRKIMELDDDKSYWLVAVES